MTSENEEQPRNRPASTRRSIWRAIIFGILAVIFAVIAFSNLQSTLLFVLFLIPAFVLGRLSYRHFKRRYSGGFSEEDLDHKGPVLYLRPFDKDAGWDGAAAFSLYRPRTWRKFPLSPNNMTALYLEMTGRASFEQVLAHVTRKIGPLVAIGEPGHPPILGARNLYVGDDNWKEQVIDLAQRSQLVILTAGISSGVLWEVNTMTREVPPDRLLLNIPGASRGERKESYVIFIQEAAEVFPAELPETINGGRFLSFGEDWQPQEQVGRSRKPEKNTPSWVAKRLNRLLI
jgi:hypothetical protein